MYLEKEDISVHSIIDTFTFLHPSKIQEQEWEIFFFHEISWSTKKSITGRWKMTSLLMSGFFHLYQPVWIIREPVRWTVWIRYHYATDLFYSRKRWMKENLSGTPGGKSQGHVWQSLWEIVLGVLSNPIMFRD